VKKSQFRPRQTGDDYTHEEAARALRISVARLYAEKAAGRIAFNKSGRRVTYTQAHLDDYRRSLEVPRTSFPEMRRIA
jgi:hypothetical protein